MQPPALQHAQSNLRPCKASSEVYERLHAGLGLGPDEASEDDSEGGEEGDEDGDGALDAMGGRGQSSSNEADEDDEDSDGELMEVERKAQQLDRARYSAQGLGFKSTPLHPGGVGGLSVIAACWHCLRGNTQTLELV